MINKNFKIVIVGPGAIGSLFAGFLTKSGFTVWLVDKDSNRVEKIKKNGIYIKDFKQKFKIKINITTSVQEIKTCDLIIICVKSYDTESALEKIKTLIKDKTLILTLQNGIGNVEIIKKFVSDEKKIITGVTYESAICLGDGKINHTGSGETIISKSQKEIISIFEKSGFKIKTSQNIDSIIWSKLIINAAINPLAAITKLHNGELLKYKETQNILEAVVMEAIKISANKKIKLLYENPIEKVKEVCKNTSSNICSMYQDILNKKRTEIDAINGIIIEEGKKIKIATPVNQVLFNLIKIMEQK